MYTYVYVYIYIYTYTYVCVYIYIYIYIVRISTHFALPTQHPDVYPDLSLLVAARERLGALLHLRGFQGNATNNKHIHIYIYIYISAKFSFLDRGNRWAHLNAV